MARAYEIRGDGWFYRVEIHGRDDIVWRDHTWLGRTDRANAAYHLRRWRREECAIHRVDAQPY